MVSFFREYGRAIDVFSNTDSITGKSAGGPHAAHTLMPFKTVFEQIRDARNNAVQTYLVSPSFVRIPDSPAVRVHAETVETLCSGVASLCSRPGEKFIMAYWPEPDATMHETGCYSDEAKAVIRNIDACVENLAGNTGDTLFIISADHGLIDISETVWLNGKNDILECLIMPPFMEDRALSFYVKEEKKDLFEKKFGQYFGDDFLLLSKKKFLKENCWGRGPVTGKRRTLQAIIWPAPPGPEC
ncbi:alkaline phosphatase family protein [Brucepastera parasyntrophica]|uniref:alkaline phosphatase family protein n=1 Tax=Brucepastera parasyntrophica TaxID=2880008 RepID=UPI00210D0413|nr:alkaline phosphatase family protein [Brucepastera parasyntrophica]ULQ60771.1 alkaline phosphatase family protein [Brucepastera parasyntrophica]